MVNIASLMPHCGYVIVSFGSVFEGETVALVDGYSVRTQVLDPPLGVLCPMLGGFTSETFCVDLGRLLGKRLLHGWARLGKSIDPFTNLIDKLHLDRWGNFTCHQLPGSAA